MHDIDHSGFAFGGLALPLPKPPNCCKIKNNQT